jgi:hypothetical protein
LSVAGGTLAVGTSLLKETFAALSKGQWHAAVAMIGCCVALLVGSTYLTAHA